MAMTYTSLIASKGTSGSIANWVNYSLLDLPVIVDEAQSLIYQYLRVREMRGLYSFTVGQSLCRASLPTGYLDPISMFAPSLNMDIGHVPEAEIVRARSYQETSGTLGTDPLTTSIGSSDVTVAFTGNNFKQGSVFTIAGATAVGGLTLNGTFNVKTPGANSFVLDCALAGTASSGATGGGASVTFRCDNLTDGSPDAWGTWDDGTGEQIQFDRAFNQDITFHLLFYKSLPLLSSSNLTNFLTTRYPNLMRSACQTAAADYMKDDSEYQKGLARLQLLIGRVQQGDDLQYRGAVFGTATPGGAGW